MVDHLHRLPQDIYAESLKTINNMHFSRREIDIIACLLSGRTAKSIASLLSIAPRTVETHTRNITLKLERNSREGIRVFIEKSEKFSFIKEHYLDLLIKGSFKKHLLQILSLIRDESSNCVIVYWDEPDNKPFINKLEEHLKLAGVLLSIERREDYKSINHLIHKIESQTVGHILCIPSFSLISALHTGNNKAKLETFPFVQKSSKKVVSVIFILREGDTTETIPKEIQEVEYIDMRSQTNYYFSCLSILERMFFQYSLEKITASFKEEYQITYGSDYVFPQLWPKDSESIQKENIKGNTFSQPFIPYNFQQQEADLWCSGIDIIIQHIKDLHNYNLTYDILLSKLKGMKTYYMEEDKARALKLLQLHTSDEHFQEINDYIEKIDVLWADTGVGIKAISSCKEMADQGRGSILDRLYDEDKTPTSRKETSFRESDWNWRMVAQIKNILQKKMEKYKELQGRSHPRVDEFRSIFSNM